VRKSVVAGLTLAILLTLGAIRAADLWMWRSHALSDARSRAGDLAVILAEYIRGTFIAGDASLRQLSLHSQRVGGPGAPAAAWMPSLNSAKAGLAGVGSISVVDAAGIIRHSTVPVIIGQSRADQYAFRKLAAEPLDDFVVSTPFLSITEPRQFLIPIARRLTTPDGAFDGILAATFIPAQPRGLVHSLNVGQHGAVWVFHPDGLVLFREPSEKNPIGEAAGSNPIFQEARRANAKGTLEGPVAPGGPVMVTGYHVMTSPPIIVAVSLDRDEILADWRRQAIGSTVVFLILGLTVVVMAAVLFRQMDANARALASEQLARRESEEAGRLKDEFLMTVSHELRTPLTAIAGWAQMLEGGILDEGKKVIAAQTIARNARMQTRLVEDLLDMSRIVGGKLRLDLQSTDVEEVIDEAIQSARPAAEAKRLAVKTAYDPSTPPIVGDAGRLQQIVWNLLSNAIKFTPPGGEVTVRLERDKTDVESICIVVSDTGSGISPDFLPHVFERFRQGDSGARRQHGGLGLGLAIVRHLVELHGGTVSAHSDGPGRGAIFLVRLPVRAPRAAAQPAVSEINLRQ
jgi:signal transduction histidine kinase